MVVTRAGLSPVMVGRALELSRLRYLSGGLSEPRVALVRGEAGVGKTRLVKELTSELPRQAVVLSAQAEQGAMGRPYELLLDAVAAAVGGWVRVPPHLRRWEDALGVLLAPVAPRLAAADRGYAADELARAGVELVRHLVGGEGGVVIFEDLHWADAESLGLFHRMAVTPDLPVLLVGSYRPEDLDRRHVTDLMATIERQRDVVHLGLDRLSIEEVGALVAAVRGQPVSYATAAGLHRRTGGNPFFVEELLVAAGDAFSDRLAELPLPETLTEAVLRHLEVLDGEQRRVIDAAAILGQRIPFDMLAAVTGLGEDVLIAVLRELVGRGLIVEDDADVFSFRHALTREAIAGRLLARERRRLHEKCLMAIEEAGSDDWAALAHHASGAGRWEEMGTFARKGAAQYLRTGATYQALRLTELALHEGDADLELLELAARSAWSVGLPSEAIERAEQWRRLAEETAGPAELTRALRVLARLKWEMGDNAGHQAAVEAARTAARSLPAGEDRAWVANLLAESAMLAERAEEALEWADEALAFGGPSTSAPLRAAVLVNRGSALVMLRGREDEAEQLLLEGLAAATEVEDYLSALRAINNLAHPAFWRWEPRRSAELLDGMAALIERSGRQDWAGSRALLEATFLAHVLGDLPRARTALEQGTTHLAKGTWSALLRAELALEAGEDAAAESHLDRVDPLTGTDSSVSEQRGQLLALRARISARQSAEAAALMLEPLCVELVGLEERRRQLLSDVWHHALVAATRAGVKPGTIRDLYGRAGVAPDAPSADPGWADHLAGALAEAEGAPEAALAAYERSLAFVAGGRRRSPAAAADTHVGAARSLLALGRREEANAHAVAAASLLEQWPGWRQAESRALLNRLQGRSGSLKDESSPSGLTGREIEVARLLAEGLTNGEVATRLYISTKTASVHVSNILRKLGMTSRAEVAAWAVREGLAG